MNMKKSIAGVMAGAMAVSAMAATVSAQDAISLTYDLKTYKVDYKATSKVTVVATYAASLTNAWYSVSADVNNELNTAGESYIRFGLDNAIVCAQVNECYAGVASTDTIGGMKDFQITATPLANISNTTGAGSLQGTPVTISWTSDKGKTDGSHTTDDLGDGKAYFDMPVALGQKAGTLPMANYELGSLGYTANAGEYGFQSVTARMSYDIPVQFLVNGANAWTWGTGAITAFGDTNMVEKTVDAETFIGQGKAMIASDHEILQAPTSVAIAAFTAGDKGDIIYPMKSALNAPANVVSSLQARKAGGNYYTRPVAVLNDAIANYEDVTFTFKSYDGYVSTAKSHLFLEWVEADRAYGWQTCSYDWYNPTFGQHLYTNVDDRYSLFGTTEFDMYGSYSDAWGVNLFTGAIVVNSGLTMQLSDTDKFDWGSDTLTFDWFSITDDGKITDAKTFLTSMLLYTPVDWYWDSLTVVVAGDAEDADSVDTGEGIDGEGDVIEEDPEVPEIVDDPVVEAPEVVEPVVEAPVQAVPSPATGNAPVALAVIPVALAAAAVVAKKRG
ncbi:MAG: hypothetical protein NC120_13605 [Ruminococcus sp.]|nr:hypothetical protein [Ruminococcus sp.]